MPTNQISEWLDLVPTILFSSAVLFVGLLGLILARKLLGFFYVFAQKKTFLEITPPALNDKNHLANESLLNALYGLKVSGSLAARLLGVKPVLSTEIVAERATGIRFFIAASERHVEAVEGLVHSYVPDAKVARTKDRPIHQQDMISRILEFTQTKHYGFPLKKYDELSTSDPTGYVTSAMTKLEDGEKIVFQVVFSPEFAPGATRLSKKILHNEHVISEMSSRGGANSILSILSTLSVGMIDLMSDILSPSSYSHSGQNNKHAYQDANRKRQAARGIHPERNLSYFEQDLVESVHEKLSNPLFRANIRVLISSPSKQNIKKRRTAIRSSMSLFDVPKYQGLKLKRRKFLIGKKMLHVAFERRMLSPTASPMYLSSTELAGLYHFPHSMSAKTENVIKSLSKTLPAPISLKNNTPLDVLIGKNIHQGSTTPIGLTSDERERHMYVIGGTGNGKTTMFKYQIVQDLHAGKAVAIVDPHGDLAEEIMGCIPESRIDDVVYINPRDISNPVAINILELPEGLEGDELLTAKDDITENSISIIRKFFSDDDTGGHRIEYVLRNTIHTALTVEGATIFTIFKLLTDAKYAKPIINKLEDENLKAFWKNELGKAGNMQAVKMSAGITAKIGRFLFSTSASRVMGQAKSTIDFQKIMDEKRILICNFSKGNLGEDTSRLFGVTVIARLQLAALKRSLQKQNERIPYYLYVDEFQNFATPGYIQMLSEARKYRLFVTMAEQSTQQQSDQQMISVIMANVGTVVIFRTQSIEDERIVLPLLEPYVEKGEIMNLPAYSFYAKIPAMKSQEPMSGMTVLLDQEPDEEIAELVKKASGLKYGVPVKKKDEKITKKRSSTKEESEPKPSDEDELDQAPEVA